MHVDEAEKLMCPFGGDCVAYQCPFGEDDIAYLCMPRRWFDPKIKNEGYCGLAGKEGAE